VGAGFGNRAVVYTSIKKGLSFYTSGSSGFICVTDVVKAIDLWKK
jgi:hypothetical protein